MANINKMHCVTQPQVIIFDWDGTLAETGKGIFYAMNKVLTAFGKEPLSAQQFAQQPHLSNRVFFRTLFPENQIKEAEALYAQHSVRLAATAFPDSALLLNWICGKGIPMAVVSNKDGELLRREVFQMGWGEYFYAVIGSYDTPEDKPSPVPLLHVLSVGGYTPGPHIWFVGDSIVDMECAHNAGCTPIAMGIESEALLESITPPKLWAKDGKKLIDVLQLAIPRRSS